MSSESKSNETTLSGSDVENNEGENDVLLPLAEEPEVYCICNGIDDGSFMLCCDICDEWFHGKCVGISESSGSKLERYICKTCKKEDGYKPADEEIKPTNLSKRTQRSTRANKDVPSPKKQKITHNKALHVDIEDNSMIDEEDPVITRQRASIITALTNALTQDGTCDESEAKKLSEEIVDTVYSNMGKGLDGKAERDEKFKSLLVHIKDEKNGPLREKIISKEMTAAKLCAMKDIELASNSEELIALQKSLQEEAMRQIIKKESNSTMYRKTHKGEELVETDADVDSFDLTNSFVDSEGARRSIVDDEDDNMISKSLDKFDESGSEEEEDDDNVPLLPRETTEDNYEDKESLEDIKKREEELEAKKESSGITSFLEEAESAPKPISNISKIDNTAIGAAVQGKPITWQGFIDKCPDLPPLGTKAVHICGKKVGKIFGLKDLNIVGRMEAAKMSEYIERLDFSTKCKRAVLYLLPQSPEHTDNYKALFQQFYEKSKVAVIDATAFSDAIREIFIAPVPKGAPVPAFIDKKGVSNLIKDGCDKLICYAVYYRSKHSTASFSPPRPEDDQIEEDNLPKLPSKSLSRKEHTKTLSELATPSLNVSNISSNPIGNQIPTSPYHDNSHVPPPTHQGDPRLAYGAPFVPIGDPRLQVVSPLPPPPGNWQQPHHGQAPPMYPHYPQYMPPNPHHHPYPSYPPPTGPPQNISNTRGDGRERGRGYSNSRPYRGNRKGRNRNYNNNR